MTIALMALAILAPNTNQGAGEISRRWCTPVHCVHRQTRRRWRHAIRPYRSWLRSTRYCESGSSGLYHANTGNGFYGAYQFTRSSWRSVDGRGWPHQAIPLEQDYRAVRLRWSQGTGAWPVCG